MNNRTEAKLKSIEGMKKAMTEILAQAWERGRKYGRLEAQEEKMKRGCIMDNKKALELLKSSQRRNYLCSECQNDADECKSLCKYGQALDCAIKALENSSHIIDALEKLKDETLDGIVKFGIEKSIECVRKIEEEKS